LPRLRRRTGEHVGCEHCGGDLPGAPHHDGYLGHLQRGMRGGDHPGKGAQGVMGLGILLLGGFASCGLLLREAAVSGSAASGDRGLPHHKLEEALREQREGCAVCRLVNRTGRRYIESLLYEGVNDPGVQAGFRESLGFCSRHAYMMLDAGDGLGTAILYRAATRELLETLSRIPDTPKLQTSLRSLLGRPSNEDPVLHEPGRGCMVCSSEEGAEEVYLRALLGGAQDGSLDGLLDGHGAVCVRHLSKASVLAEGWLPHALIEVTREALSDLEADLGLYIRHNDYRYSNEPWGKERDSWKRAVAKMVGPRRP
jgi:hypothetical protein